jgi:arginine utilization protein RocB
MSRRPLDPADLRALAERLVAIPSVSPDVAGENACVRALAEALPAGAARGTWTTPDGREVLWAHVPGRTARTVVMLGHVDTVGADEYSALGGGPGLAFDPPALRARLLELDREGRLPAEVMSDLIEERRAPGRWLFGRGGLDMKAGLAAAVGALHALAARPAPAAGGALLVVTPDEEHASVGMRTAVPGLVRLREERGLEYAGAINLDYTPSPAVHRGVMGKVLAMLWVLGRPTHVGRPFGGVDAAQVAAEIAARAARSRALIDRGADGHGVPAVTLRLRDLKERYDVQTTAEAVVELNLITCERSLDATMGLLQALAIEALGETLRGMAGLAEWLEPERADFMVVEDLRERVLTWPRLCERAGVAPGDDPLAGEDPGEDARANTLERVRRLARRAGLEGPAVVVVALPPYYPPSVARTTALTRAVAALAARERLALRPQYPLISDACLLAWRAEGAAEVARHLPALGREYVLPCDSSRTLDLDVVSLGPWGHDAHGLYERCDATFAFETLPRLLAGLVDDATRE